MFDHKDLQNVKLLGILPVSISCRGGTELSPQMDLIMICFRELSHTSSPFGSQGEILSMWVSNCAVRSRPDGGENLSDEESKRA